MKRKHNPGSCTGGGCGCCKCCNGSCNRKIRELRVRVRWAPEDAPVEYTIPIGKTLCDAKCYVPVKIGCTGPVRRLVYVGPGSVNNDNDQVIYDFKITINIPSPGYGETIGKLKVADCYPLSTSAMVEYTGDDSSQSLYWQDERYVHGTILKLKYKETVFSLTLNSISGVYGANLLGQFYPSPLDIQTYIQEQVRQLAEPGHGGYTELEDAEVIVEMIPNDGGCDGPLDDTTFSFEFKSSEPSGTDRIVSRSIRRITHGIFFEIMPPRIESEDVNASYNRHPEITWRIFQSIIGTINDNYGSPTTKVATTRAAIDFNGEGTFNYPACCVQETVTSLSPGEYNYVTSGLEDIGPDGRPVVGEGAYLIPLHAFCTAFNGAPVEVENTGDGETGYFGAPTRALDCDSKYYDCAISPTDPRFAIPEVEAKIIFTDADVSRDGNDSGCHCPGKIADTSEDPPTRDLLKITSIEMNWGDKYKLTLAQQTVEDFTNREVRTPGEAGDIMWGENLWPPADRTRLMRSRYDTVDESTCCDVFGSIVWKKNSIECTSDTLIPEPTYATVGQRYQKMPWHVASYKRYSQDVSVSDSDSDVTTGPLDVYCESSLESLYGSIPFPYLGPNSSTVTIDRSIMVAGNVRHKEGIALSDPQVKLQYKTVDYVDYIKIFFSYQLRFKRKSYFVGATVYQLLTTYHCTATYEDGLKEGSRVDKFCASFFYPDPDNADDEFIKALVQLCFDETETQVTCGFDTVGTISRESGWIPVYDKAFFDNPIEFDDIPWIEHGTGPSASLPLQSIGAAMDETWPVGKTTIGGTPTNTPLDYYFGQMPSMTTVPLSIKLNVS